MRGLFSIEEGIARINTLSDELYRLNLYDARKFVERYGNDWMNHEKMI